MLRYLTSGESHGKSLISIDVYKRQILNYIMPKYVLFKFIKYLIITLYAVAGVPALFKITKLA